MNDIIKYILNQGMFKTKKEIIENAWWFNVASLLGLIRPTIKYNGKIEPLNYFGFTFAGSSAGKSFSFKETKKLLNIKEDGYVYLIKDTLAENANIELTDKQTVSDYINEMYINIGGTKEGIYQRALALKYANAGSLNIVNDEFLDNINNAINMIKELSEGHLKAQTTKHNIDPNINEIWANSLLFGSSLPLKKDLDIYKKVSSAFGSGIYRRAFIVYEDIKNIEKRQYELVDDTKIKKGIEQFKNFIANIYEGRKIKNFKIELKIDNEEALNKINEIFEKLIELSNENKDDERLGAEHGSLFKILKLAGLHSLFFYQETNIKIESLNYAFDFFLRTRSGVKELFKIEPQHKRIYKIIKKFPGITKSQILSADLFNRNTFNEDLEFVEEEAFVNNEILKTTGSKIKKYSIEPLPQTNLDRLIISLNNEKNKGAKAINFIQAEIDFEMLKDVCKSEKLNAFTLCHFNGTRKRANVIKGQNLIAFDIDDGTTLDEIKIMFKDFTYLIYTTKNHQKEKNGVICDRFRLILPTKTLFYVDNEQHKEMILNIANMFGLTIFDVSTRNQDRLWFPNPNAKIYENFGELLDVSCCIPETVKAVRIKNTLDKYDPITEDKRIEGMIKWTIAEAIPGNRNNALFRLFKFIEDIKGKEEAVEVVHQVNNILIEPLPENEINKTTRR